MGVAKSNGTSKQIYTLHHIHWLSFRQIAAHAPFTGIPVGTIYSIYKGKRVPNKWREQLRLPLLVKVPENMVRKTTPSASPDKRHRRAINLDDPASAAATIRSAGTTAEYRRRLAALLLDEFQDDAR